MIININASKRALDRPDSKVQLNVILFMFILNYDQMPLAHQLAIKYHKTLELVHIKGNAKYKFQLLTIQIPMYIVSFSYKTSSTSHRKINA